MGMTRRVFIGTGAAMATIVAGQLGRTSQAQQAPRPGGAINLYSARHYDSDDALYQSFVDRTGIQVQLVEAEADQLIERIKSEGANSPADVLLTVDAGRLWRAQQEDLFQPIQSSILTAAIPANLRDSDGLWFGLSKRARVIMYNKDRVNPAELSTYENLADSKWRGRVLVRSSTSVYNQSLVGSMIEALGADATSEWAQGLVANFARPPEGGDTTQIQGIASGVGDLAISNTYYLARYAGSTNPEERAIADRVGVFFPNQRDRGTHVNISGGGVLKTARNKDGAVRFLEHLVGLEAQEIFAKGNYEYPVLTSAPLDPIVASFGQFREDTMSASIFGRNNAAALQLMDRAGWK